jgi:polysaccharide export outer membrane protein
MIPIRHLLASFGLIVSCFVWAQQPAPQQSNSGSMPQPIMTSPQGPVGPLQQRDPRYELRPGDVLDIGFTFSPEFNQVVPVQPDGYVTLRDAGDLHVAGLSLPQLREAIAKAYRGVLHEPEVTVQLKEFEKPYFIATGQVARPGKYELRGTTRVTEAIAIAGGLTDAAKHSQVVLFRHVSPNWMEGKLVDVKKMLSEKNLNEDLFVHAGDIVYVPQSRFSHFRRFIPAPGLGMSFNPTPY